MTKQERAEAIETEAQLAVNQFIAHSKKSDWFLTDFDFDEIAAYGHLLKPDTITLMEGFMWIEAQLPFYLSEQEKAFQDVPSERMFRKPWGDQEALHKPTLALVLINSGARTEAQIDEYNAQVFKRGWSAKDHKGLETLVDARAYRALQERATWINYLGLLHLIRQDYGLPQTMTDMERERRRQIGVADPVSRIASHELGHHGIGVQLLRVHLKYQPEETRESIDRVRKYFIMPLRNLSNRRIFVQALQNTQVYNRTIQRQMVIEPTMKTLGLAS